MKLKVSFWKYQDTHHISFGDESTVYTLFASACVSFALICVSVRAVLVMENTVSCLPAYWSLSTVKIHLSTNLSYNHPQQQQDPVVPCIFVK
mmetsp:Transcript_11687/g.18090  ORF Transcript_11687/g.18090 Transcript_11687/m.18090 type:complete len:92 (-) Transcript_11687:190-465(-)